MEALAAEGSLWCYIPIQVCQQLELYCLEAPTLVAKIGADGNMKVLAKIGKRGDSLLVMWPSSPRGRVALFCWIYSEVKTQPCKISFHFLWSVTAHNTLECCVAAQL